MSSLAAETFDVGAVHGRVQIVESFPDYKVRFVDALPDLRVQKVDSFRMHLGNGKSSTVSRISRLSRWILRGSAPRRKASLAIATQIPR